MYSNLNRTYFESTFLKRVQAQVSKHLGKNKNNHQLEMLQRVIADIQIIGFYVENYEVRMKRFRYDNFLL